MPLMLKIMIIMLLAVAEPPRYDVDLLARSLELRLTYPSSLRAGRKPYHLWHCRKAPEGCVARVRAFAGYFVAAGRETGVSPWLLAAMALRESGLHPFASGGVGEVGILQLHPKRKDTRRLRFLTDTKYRERCRRLVGACQAELILTAARALSRAIDRCGTTLRALRAYNTGRCNGTTTYPVRVSQELAKLYRFAEGEANA